MAQPHTGRARRPRLCQRARGSARQRVIRRGKDAPLPCPPAAHTARPAHARRADQPLGPFLHPVAGGHAEKVPRHRADHLARPLLHEQRLRLHGGDLHAPPCAVRGQLRSVHRQAAGRHRAPDPRIQAATGGDRPPAGHHPALSHVQPRKVHPRGGEPGKAAGKDGTAGKAGGRTARALFLRGAPPIGRRRTQGAWPCQGLRGAQAV